jgi:hypothetical protein
MRPAEVAKAVAELVGLPYLGSSRALDMEMFGFGTLQEGTGRRGRPTVRPSYALHVQAPWRIVVDDRIVVGYSDWRDPPAGVSTDGWDPNEASLTHRDELLAVFLDRPPSRRVAAASTALTGDLRLNLDDGSALEVVADSAALDDEHWRLLAGRLARRGRRRRRGPPARLIRRGALGRSGVGR